MARVEEERIMLIAPFPRTSSPFGEWPQWRRDMGLGPHRGLDFVCAEGWAIPASGVGVCTGRGYSIALGYWVVVRYATEIGEIYFGYCHLREDSHLRYGVWVRTGETVGIVGNTGSATTGAHLHLTASWSNGNPGSVPVVDPAPFLTGSATAGGNQTPVNPPAKTPEQIEEEELMGAREDIMAHVTQTMEVVRREERPRLFERATTGELMLVKVTTGFMIGPWDPKEDAGKAESLIVNGYQLLTRQEFDRRQKVDDIRWANIQGEVKRHRRELAKAVVEVLDERAAEEEAEHEAASPADRSE